MSQKRDNPRETQRSQLYKKSPSTQYIRDELRKRFQERLKLTRSTQQCRTRNFYSSIVSDVQNQLVGTVGFEEGLNKDEILELLLEIEHEESDKMLQKEAEDYESLVEQEINVLLQDTSYACQICNKPVQSPNDANNVICSACGNLYFNTEQL